jgi:hypothetical protein
MAFGTIAARTRVAPWALVGAGLVSQPGECPADASDTSPDCKTALTPGGLVSAGIRWRLLHHLALGVETAFVIGTTTRERHFRTERYGFTVRVQ